jgi:hypothetical protein
MIKGFPRLLSVLLLLCIVVRARRFDYECNEDLDHLSVGHIHLTDANFKKFKKEVMATTKVFILGASDSSCDQCCFTETLLDNVKEKFDKKVHTGKVRQT